MMKIPLHMAVRIDSHFFEPEVARRIELLGGGSAAVRRVAEAHPHGVSSCFIGVGGFALENTRFRGFEGPIPLCPSLLDAHNLKIYAEAMATMRNTGGEDQMLAGMVGAVCGATVGIVGLGAAAIFTSSMAVASIPGACVLPGALMLGLPYRREFLQKYERLGALLTMTSALTRPASPSVMEDAFTTAMRCQQSDDWLLNQAAHQFAQASNRILPPYEERGLPAYSPPNDDSPLSVFRERAQPDTI
jgi:hypothetical protein